MKIHAAMICGPGEGDRYLDEVLHNAASWADKTIVVTDHVDAVTTGVLARRRVVVYESEGPRFTDDESHVRNQLMSALDMLARAGDLVVVLDADELLLAPPANGANRGARSVLEALSQDRAHQAWSGTFFHLWDPLGQFYRADGGWAPAPQFRVYRHEPGERVEQRRMACTAIPSSRLPRAHTGLVFAHLGYQLAKDRVRKHARYMQLDGGRFHSRAHLESIVGEPTLAPFDG